MLVCPSWTSFLTFTNVLLLLKGRHLDGRSHALKGGHEIVVALIPKKVVRRDRDSDLYTKGMKNVRVCWSELDSILQSVEAYGSAKDDCQHDQAPDSNATIVLFRNLLDLLDLVPFRGVARAEGPMGGLHFQIKLRHLRGWLARVE